MSREIWRRAASPPHPPSHTSGFDVLSCSLAVLDPRVGHTMDVLSPFISVILTDFHGESCPRLDVVHPGRAWPSSPSCTWHCSWHYLFLQATPLFSDGVTIVCQLPCFVDVFTTALLKPHSFVFFAVHKTRRIFLSPFNSKDLILTENPIKLVFTAEDLYPRSIKVLLGMYRPSKVKVLI